MSPQAPPTGSSQQAVGGACGRSPEARVCVASILNLHRLSGLSRSFCWSSGVLVSTRSCRDLLRPLLVQTQTLTLQAQEEVQARDPMDLLAAFYLVRCVVVDGADVFGTAGGS